MSIDDYYHRAQNTTPFMYLVDTDTTAALMVTDNLTQASVGYTAKYRPNSMLRSAIPTHVDFRTIA